MTGSWPSIAVWAITPHGAKIAKTIAERFPGAALFTGRGVARPPERASVFTSLAGAVAREYANHDAHVFVMAAGIVVRLIAPHIGSKQSDPAIVVVDDAGRFAVSLLSGHANGANELAGLIAHFTGAAPVITTATDNAGVPAIDVLAKQQGLFIENPAAVKTISMAFLTGQQVWRHDPWKILESELSGYTDDTAPAGKKPDIMPGIYIDHTIRGLPEYTLVVRPRTLSVGVGLNRQTGADELICAVQAVFDQYRLSTASIAHFATIDKKTGEPGLIEMAAFYDRPVLGFSKEKLAGVTNVPTPSGVVQKHMGVPSVCEAAAMLSMNTKHLLVPKQKTKNTTLAVAETPCT